MLADAAADAAADTAAEGSGKLASLFAAVGEAVGSVTAALQEFQHAAATREFVWDLQRCFEVVESHIGDLKEGQQQDLVRRVLDAQRLQLASLLPKLRRSIVHNDPNDYNLVVGVDGRVGVLDFGDMLFSYTCSDAAIGMAYLFFHVPEHTPLAEGVRPFVEAFHQKCPLEEAEADALFALAVCRVCTSVCMSAYQSRLDPGNEYLLISAKPAWRLLERVDKFPGDAAEVPNLELNDGKSMPILGFGCYKVGVVPGSAAGAADAPKPAPAKGVIADALAAGYRCFDCAQFYENEDAIGEAFQVAGVPREELYIISKVWTNIIHDGPKAVRQQCLKSIKDLGCGFLDLYMIHWPVPGKHVEAYQELVALQAEGLIKSIGVSNYTVEDLSELQAAKLPLPAVNQIEINPFLYRKKTIAHFKGLGIQLQAYRALCNFGKAASLESEVVGALAAKHGRSASQILGKWCIQKGFQHIPKSEKRSRMEENARLFDFELDTEDMDKLENLTTPAALETFKSSYLKGIVRDTPLQASAEAIRKDITLE